MMWAVMVMLDGNHDYVNHDYDDDKDYLRGCQMCGSVCLNDQNLAEVKVGAENIFE